MRSRRLQRLSWIRWRWGDREGRDGEHVGPPDSDRGGGRRAGPSLVDHRQSHLVGSGGRVRVLDLWSLLLRRRSPTDTAGSYESVPPTCTVNGTRPSIWSATMTAKGCEFGKNRHAARNTGSTNSRARLFMEISSPVTLDVGQGGMGEAGEPRADCERSGEAASLLARLRHGCRGGHEASSPWTGVASARR